MESLPHHPSVSVVVPTRNAADHLSPLLSTILAQKYAGTLEVMVADGSDNEDTVELIRRHFLRVRLIPNPEYTVSQGMNEALAAGASDVVVRCDTFATLPPGYIQRAVETLQRTGAANVGGWQCPIVEGRLIERSIAISQSIPLGVGRTRHRRGGAEGPTDTVYLGVFRREALEAIGGFDPTLLRNQDYALNWCLRKNGETVWFDPNLKVAYRPRRTLRTVVRQYFDYGRWKSVVVWRHPRSLRARHLVSPLLVLGLVASALWTWSGTPVLLAAAVPFTYLLVLLGEGMRVGISRREPAAALLPLVLMLMHLSWGIGFFCPPRSIRKKGTTRLCPPFSEETSTRLPESLFPDPEQAPVTGLASEGIRPAEQPKPATIGAARVAEAGRGVSVVILTWNSVGKIEPCLESLGQSTRVPDEIIVVDNGSTDQTRAVLARQFPAVRVIANTHNRGVARARNQGLAAARGTYLLVLDDDTVVLPDALARLVSVLDTNPTVAVCGPQLLNSVRQPVDLDLPFPTLWHKARRWGNAGLQNGRAFGNGLSDGMRDVAYVIGACQLIRRAALAEVGSYDERIFYGPEDIDFCLRLHSSGWRVVCQPAAQVIHAEQHIARSMRSTIGRKHVVGLAHYFWKHRYGLSRKRLSARLPT